MGYGHTLKPGALHISFVGQGSQNSYQDELYVAICWCMLRMLLYAAVCRCMLLYAAVCCCMLLYAAVCCCMFLHAAVCCCMLLYVAVCCCMLLYAAYRSGFEYSLANLFSLIFLRQTCTVVKPKSLPFRPFTGVLISL